MGLRKDYDENHHYTDFNLDESEEELGHKKRVRKLLEDRLEKKRLKEELEDFENDEFDWDNIDC